MGVGWPRPPSLPLRGLRGACAPLRKRLAIHPGPTACSETRAAFGRRSIPAEPRRCAPLVVAFRSKYTRYSSLTRLVSRTPTGRTGPRRPRRSRGFHHRLLTVSLRATHRCVSVEIHQVFLPHAPCQPGPHREDWPHRENWASPLSALTRVPPQAVKSSKPPSRPRRVPEPPPRGRGAARGIDRPWAVAACERPAFQAFPGLRLRHASGASGGAAPRPARGRRPPRAPVPPAPP